MYSRYLNFIHYLQITSTKLQWNAKPKIGSLDNASYKPGGGDKKIESLKTDFTKAKSKVGSKENMKHLPGGGEFKVNIRNFLVLCYVKITFFFIKSMIFFC